MLWTPTSGGIIGEIKPYDSPMSSRGEVFLAAGRQIGEFLVVDPDSGGSGGFKSDGHLSGNGPQ